MAGTETARLRLHPLETSRQRNTHERKGFGWENQAARMTEQEFRAVYPLIADWIKKTLAKHAPAARLVASLGFSRLARYYDGELLASSKAVVVPKVPMPPLTAMGLDRFRDFEHMDSAGITYLNTIFVRADRARDESLHFHELVHVIQWRLI